MPRARRHALVFLVLSLYCLLVLPRMLSYGMFMDGVVYASIARNMAENYGSFWQPYYTATTYPIFYEHPPLGFWLQSWAYRLCGDSRYVETWWGCGIGTLLLVVLAGIWRCLTPQGYAVAGAWFPIMLFIVMPMTSWAVANNMLENTMTCFILLSVLLCLLSLKNQTMFFSCLYGILSGLSMFCAILIKGPVALFPLAVPLLSMLYDAKKIRKVSTITIILLMTLLVSFGLTLSTNTAAVHFFKRYVSRQVLASITSAPATTMSRFNVLTVVSRENLVPLLVGGTLTAQGDDYGRRPRPRRASALDSAEAEQLVGLRQDADVIRVTPRHGVQAREPLAIDLRPPGGVDDRLHEDRNDGTNRLQHGRGPFDVVVER